MVKIVSSFQAEQNSTQKWNESVINMKDRWKIYHNKKMNVTVKKTLKD